ncbi:HD domain-containing protein [Oceanotoga sp. DSM 15011]|jgi:HD-GYP domain-containing protein (c-di-GMP phosphodiesterase class II)|uniref:HD-GYP domain-containing protein (C-di-GMP phosphodiesterase class II) n=1 Tax=Oceanotoga teriensis TaxID=515440 RepID=A0AA45HHQ8_9BACT|nr:MULTISPECIES: HD domain-containing phosphohydrolase [Oceanotoga]MDN5343173.1 hypothetical protein [Oceanotoga sp.]MDO7977745.1 HD domain-containing protein [Oceanotoga teriensis]PWJ87140.1 HD-GYP domain-containing protein (c-di-GMP phosphodiesterase class II) [Oceanotoga teriensis]UYP00744.1 HD domain-containing protein [Oceanotoga sp. DSM 15011]
MRKVLFSDLQPGYVIAEDVTKNSIILLSEGTVLTAHDIQQLKNYSIKMVYVYDEDDFQMDKDIKIIFKEIPPVVEKQKYESWTNQFEKVKDITKLNENSEELNTLVKDIYSTFVEEENIVLNLFHAIGDEALTAHSINTAIISSIISVNLKMPYVFTFQLLKASLLHDIGYSFLGERVINDYEDLENKTVKSHLISGYKAMKNFKDNISKEAIDAILEHHERYDGKGIFMRLSGERINPLVRILQVGDAYDSMIESGKNPYEAISFLLKQSGKMFDPYYVSTFFSITGLYPTGTTVLLNNNKKAIVVKKGRATVFPVVEMDGERIETGSETGIFIKEVLKGE